MEDFGAIEVLWIALSAFFVVVGVGLLFLLIRLGATVRRLTAFIQGLEREVLPLLGKVGGTVERVNTQLDKVDQVTTSAADAADSVDTAVRAVSLAIARPVQKISGLAAGLTQGVAALRAHRDVRGAFEAARTSAERREREIAEELDSTGPTR